MMNRESLIVLIIAGIRADRVRTAGQALRSLERSPTFRYVTTVSRLMMRGVVGQTPQRLSDSDT
jgi:hypothetical protein